MKGQQNDIKIALYRGLVRSSAKSEISHFEDV